MIKISIRANIYTREDSDPVKRAFEEGSKLGFDGLELCKFPIPLHDTQPNPITTEWKVGVKNMIKQYNMSIFSLSLDWAWAYSYFFPDFKDWGRAVELMAKDAKLAKELGAHTALMHFGTSTGSWKNCRAIIKDIAAVGERQGIVFGYEISLWRHAKLGGFEKLLNMVDEVGSPYFGVYLHNHYPQSGPPLHEAVEKAGERGYLVKSMHSSSLVSSEEEIDFEKTFASMKKYFADGVYTFEIPWEKAKENKKFIDEMIAKYW